MKKLEYLSKEEIIDQRLFSRIEAVGVYFLIKNKEIIYIGKTSSIFNRLNNHKGVIDYDSYYFIPTHESVLDFDETKYILKYMPVLNKTISCAECTDYLGWYSRSRIILELCVAPSQIEKLDTLLTTKKPFKVFNKTYFDIGDIKEFKSVFKTGI